MNRWSRRCIWHPWRRVCWKTAQPGVPKKHTMKTKSLFEFLKGYSVGFLAAPWSSDSLLGMSKLWCMRWRPRCVASAKEVDLSHLELIWPNLPQPHYKFFVTDSVCFPCMRRCWGQPRVRGTASGDVDTVCCTPTTSPHILQKHNGSSWDDHTPRAHQEAEQWSLPLSVSGALRTPRPWQRAWQSGET